MVKEHFDLLAVFYEEFGKSHNKKEKRSFSVMCLHYENLLTSKNNFCDAVLLKNP